MGVMRSRVMVATLVMVAACGDGLIESTDAAPGSDDGHGVVSVRYLADASDLAGLIVYFQNADSTIALATHTDADGYANAFMAPGGFLSLIHI